MATNTLKSREEECLSYCSWYLADTPAPSSRLRLTWHREGEQPFSSTLSILNDFTCLPGPALVLHPGELAYYQSVASPLRQTGYLAGRFCGKQVLEPTLGLPWPSIHIANGVFGQPLVKQNSHNLGISIAHCAHAAAALSFPEAHPMAVDIEERQPRLVEILTSQWTATEQTLFAATDALAASVTLWTAKEALAKVLHVGLTIPLAILEVKSMHSNTNYSVLHFTHFLQYRAICFPLVKQSLALVVPARSILIDVMPS